MPYYQDYIVWEFRKLLFYDFILSFISNCHKLHNKYYLGITPKARTRLSSMELYCYCVVLLVSNCDISTGHCH